MKGILLFLILSMVSVTHPIYAQPNCFFSELEVVSTSLGSPFEGPYQPCEEISFRVGIFKNGQHSQYLHGIGLDLGPCWDYAYYDQMTNEPSQVQLFTPIPNNSFEGQWQWYEDGEILYTGFQSPFYLPYQPVGSGWFYTHPGQNPNSNFGDIDYPGEYKEFYFALTIGCEIDCNINPTNLTCDVSFKIFSDSETGSYQTPGCFLDAPELSSYSVNCCETPEILYPTEHTICSGDRFILDLPNANSNSFYNWTASNNPSISGGSDGYSLIDGLTINQQLTNSSPSVQTLYYTIEASNTLPGCGLDPVVVTVTILPDLIVNLEPTNPICAGECAEIFANVLNDNGPFTYEWSNGDSGNSPFHADCSFANAPVGFYQVTVTNTNTGCQKIAELEVFSQPPLFVYAGPNVDIPCNETSTTLSAFSDGNIIEYIWHTPDGQGLFTQTIIAEIPGTYFLTAYDVANGCIASDEVIVSLSQELSGVDAGSSQNVFCGENATILDASNTLSGTNLIYSWSTSDGIIIANENTLTPTVGPGTYVLNMTDTISMCTGTDEVIVYPTIATIETGFISSTGCTVNPILLDGSNSIDLPGVTYIWSTTDGHILTPTNENQIEVDQSGTYTLVVTEPSGCSGTTSITLENVNVSPVINAGDDLLLTCNSNNPIVLEGQVFSLGSNYTYEWTYNNEIISEAIFADVLGDGIYRFVVTNTITNCVSSDQVEVLIDQEAPTVSMTNNVYNLTCLNSATTTLNATGSSTGPSFSYQWIDPSGNEIETTNPLMPIVSQEGSYTLIITNTINGCVESASTLVSDLHTIEVITQNIDCDNDLGTAFVDVTNIDNPNFKWSNGALTNDIVGLSSGNYQVTVSGENGICEEVVDVSIEEDFSCKVIIGGYVYEDVLNPNCQLDNNENGLEGVTVNLQPDNISATTDSDGYYEFVVNTGNYTIQVQPTSPYILQCSNGMIPVSLQDTSDVSLTNNFYLQVLTDFDLIINGQSSTPVPGNMQSYTLSYCNYGIQPISGYVSFTHDPQLVWSNPTGAGVTYDPATFTATWNFSTIPFLVCGSIQFNLQIPADFPVGATIISEANVFPTIGDLNPSNNQKIWSKVTRAMLISAPPSSTVVIAPQVGTLDKFFAYQNQPNPFSMETQIRFSLPKTEVVTLEIFDLSGRKLLHQEKSFSKGINDFTIQSAELDGKGVLIYKIKTKTDSSVGKMFKL